MCEFIVLLGTCHYGSDALIVLLTAKAPGAVRKMEYTLKTKKNSKHFWKATTALVGSCCLSTRALQKEAQLNRGW